MKYQDTISAEFVKRINRFVAIVKLDGREETVHVKNTGRCRELLLPGATVILADGKNADRKTRYDLVTVYKNQLGWVNIDSQAPNAVVNEWLKDEKAKRPDELQNLSTVRSEYSYGSSRVDFYLESKTEKILMEVKGCTLEVDGIGYFPDAPTERGIKHLRELTSAVKDGYAAYLAFVIAMPGIKEVRANMDTHPQFGEALKEAIKAGVHVLFLTTDITENSVRVNGYYHGNP